MIYVIGNGGSASTSSHIVTDLGVGSLGKQNPIRAISLTDNSSVITATANDYSYAQIFERQIRLLCQEGDLVLAISASGNSVNLISAVKIAKELGCITVGMTGFDGGLLKKIVDISVHIQTAIGDYGPAEDLHMMFGHSITELIRQRVEL
jgi:D-sedoheptulose 7-phosphate isomerase